MTNAPRVIGLNDTDGEVQTIKEMVIKALTIAGGVDYLVERAKENPQQFMMLVGKVLPMQVAADASAFEVRSVNYNNSAALEAATDGDE